MAPFRASRSTRSGRPATQNEQDVFDGLPIRQWRFQLSALGTGDDGTGAGGPAPDAPVRGKAPWVEFPMPKGSEHYPTWCQQILREARLGRVVSAAQGYGRPVFGRSETKDEDKENDTGAENDDGSAGNKRAKTPGQTGFIASRWTQTARHLEEPEVEFLAKRRKGLPSIHGAGNTVVVAPPVNTSSVGVVAVAPGTMPVNSGTLRKVKVKRANTQGIIKIWEVLRPDGHPIDGELDDATMTAEDAAIPIEKPEPGTVVDGLGTAGDDGAIIASFSAIPSLSINVTPLPPRGPKRKPKGGFRKGRSRKLGVGETGGVSASAEALYASGLVAPADGVPTIVTVDVEEDSTNVVPEGDDGSEGEVDEEEVDDAEAEGDVMDEGEDAAGDEDREEGELTPDATEEPELTDTFAPTVGALPGLSVHSKPLQPPPASLPPRPLVSAASNNLSPQGDYIASADTPLLITPMQPTMAASTIEELATEPSLPVGAELSEPPNLLDDQEAPPTPAETESSYAPPDLEGEDTGLGISAIADANTMPTVLESKNESPLTMDIDTTTIAPNTTDDDKDVKMNGEIGPISSAILVDEDEEYEPPPVEAIATKHEVPHTQPDIPETESHDQSTSETQELKQDSEIVENPVDEG